MSENPVRPLNPRTMSAVVGLALLTLLVLWFWSAQRLVPAEDPLARAPYSLPVGLNAKTFGATALCVVALPDGKPQPFSTLNVSAFWTSLLLPVSGACPPLAWTELSVPPPPSVRLLVLSAPALKGLERNKPSLLVSLSRWIELGGMVWLEQPGPETSAALRLQGTLHPLPQDADGMVGLLEADFPRFPYHPVTLAGPVQPLLSTRGEGPSTLLSWLEPKGQGAVLVLTFELSRLLLGVIQGRPQEDYSIVVQPRSGPLAGLPVPTDLTSDNPSWTMPVALQLVERLWRVSAQEVFLPSWWRHPQGAPGSFIMSHDEEGFGDRSLFMAEEEERLGQHTGAFVLSVPLSARGAADLRQHGMELYLHWHRGFMGGNTEPLKVGPLEVGARALTLAQQRSRLEALVGGTLPPITRIHGLQWDADWDSTFKRMVAAGLAMDSSYGPVGNLSPWRFGTLEPFFPLDRQGHLLPILEAPFALQDDEAPPYQALQDLIALAGTEGLTVIPIVHMNTMAHKPSNDVLRTWLESFGWARAAGLWPGTMTGLLAFHLERLRSEVRVEVGSMGEYGLTVKPAGEMQWVRLPGQVRGLRLQEITDSGETLERSDLRVLPEGDTLVRAQKGLLRVLYR